MADTYDLVTSQSSIQVISPTVVQDVVVATIRTKPSGVFADLWIAQDQWDAGLAGNSLAQFAANIEQLRTYKNVIGASSGQTLDASGLLQSELTFVVGYTPPGSPYGPATVDVTVPADDLNPNAPTQGQGGMQAAMAAIDAAYQKLVAAAAGPAAPQQTSGA